MRIRQLFVLPAALVAGMAHSGGGDPVADWSRVILEHQPEKVLGQAYGELARGARQAGANRLGGATGTLIHENGQLLGEQGVANWELGLSVPLKALRQGKVYGQVAEGYDQLAEAQQAYLAWQSRGIARRLLDAVAEKAVMARHDRMRLEQARKLYDLVKRQVEAGARSRLDLALAQQRLSQAEAQKAASEAALKAALAQLTAWGIELKDADPMALLRQAPEPVALTDLEAVIERHPRLRLLRARQALAEAEAAKGVWDAQPGTEVYVGVKRERADGAPDDTLVIAELSVPLGKAPEAQLARAQARLSRAQAAAEVALARRDLKQALIVARAQLEKARAQLAPAQAQLTAAEAALRLSEQAWRQGEITLRDLLLAQQAALDAALNVALANLALHRAIRNLNQQAGE